MKAIINRIASSKTEIIILLVLFVMQLLQTKTLFTVIAAAIWSFAIVAICDWAKNFCRNLVKHQITKIRKIGVFTDAAILVDFLF